MTSVDADYAIRVIRARCSDTFAPSDLLAVEAALNSDDGEALAREIAERIADVLDALDERLAATEARHETA
jgi:hypothetical protein